MTRLLSTEPGWYWLLVLAAILLVTLVPVCAWLERRSERLDAETWDKLHPDPERRQRIADLHNKLEANRSFGAAHCLSPAVDEYAARMLADDDAMDRLARDLERLGER